MFNLTLILIQQEALIAWRDRSQFLLPLFFLLTIVSVFPLMLNVPLTQLKLLAPGIIWLGVVLSELLMLPKLFDNDFADGSLEQMLLNHQALQWMSFKLVFHWLMHCAPILCFIPVLALMFDLSLTHMSILFISLLVGTLILHLLGAMVSALMLGLPQGGLLLPLLVIPLFVPVVILGISCVTALNFGMSAWTSLALLVAIFLACLAVLPWLTLSALRIGLQST